MKGCELCSGAARMYCESDQARLCWDCDARVHGANFLVARHTRRLLCRACQSPTPWRAAGPRLAPTLSLCHRCCNKSAAAGQQEEEDVDDERQEAAQVRDGDAIDHDEEDDDEDDEDEEEEEEEEEDGDNQVVPWSSTTTATPPPPPLASSSSSEESTSRIGNGFLKRMRENADPFSENDLAASSSSSHPIYFVSHTLPSLSAARTAAAAAAAEDEATSYRSASARAVAGGAAAKKPQRNSLSSVAIRTDRRDVRTVDLVSSSSRSPPI